jgi:hypothetical protein
MVRIELLWKMVSALVAAAGAPALGLQAAIYPDWRTLPIGQPPP